MTNEEAKNRYKNYRPGVPKTNIKDAFFRELKGYNSVFEFGCNNGWNLAQLKLMYPKISVLGIDVNRKEVMKGRRRGRKYVIVGDENYLKTMKDNSFDVVFTSSVICHIPDADEVIKNLKRIAKRKVVLIETQDVHNEYYFPHDYEGFKIVRSMKSIPGNECLYHQYEWICE